MRPSVCEACDTETDVHLDSEHGWMCEECRLSIYHPRRMIAAMKFHWFLVACQKNAPRAELLERLVAVRAANQAIEDPTVRTRAIQSCEDIVLRLGYV